MYFLGQSDPRRPRSLTCAGSWVRTLLHDNSDRPPPMPRPADAFASQGWQQRYMREDKAPRSCTRQLFSIADPATPRSRPGSTTATELVGPTTKQLDTVKVLPQLEQAPNSAALLHSMKQSRKDKVRSRNAPLVVF